MPARIRYEEDPLDESTDESFEGTFEDDIENELENDVELEIKGNISRYNKHLTERGAGIYPRINGFSYLGNKLSGYGFQPTDEQRNLVKMLAGHGLVQLQMIKYIINPRTGTHISENTLQKAFHDELIAGRAEMNLAVSQKVLEGALGSPAEYDKQGNQIRSEKHPYFPAQQWWEKTRAGMKETTAQEYGVKEGTKVTLIIEG